MKTGKPSPPASTAENSSANPVPRFTLRAFARNASSCSPRNQSISSSKPEHQRRAQFIAALVDTRQEFLKTCLLGVAVAAVLTLLYANGGGPHTLREMLFVGCYCFFIPFGWKLLTYLQSFLPVTIFGTLWFWLFWICTKGVISIFVGIPALCLSGRSDPVQSKADPAAARRTHRGSGMIYGR